MGKNYLLAIDEGTTGVTLFVIDESLNRIADASEDFNQYFPTPGWVEHRPDEIWAAILSCLKKLAAKIDLKRVVTIGITNQRETVCFWEKNSTEVISPAIVWQDRRTADHCAQLKKKKLEPVFQKKTGLLLDPYFSGTKISWAMKNWASVAAAQKKGRLQVGTVDSFVLARLTKGKSYVTEPSNASRTLLFDIHRLEWSRDIKKQLGLADLVLPEVQTSFGVFGVTSGVPGILDGTPITGILGDQQAALLGQACTRAGSAKCTYGTGAFILMNTGEKPVMSKNRLLTTIAWQSSNQKVTYALEGSAFMAGAAIQWVRDGLGLIKNSDEIEALALSVPDTQGVVFVPALTGLGAPHWNPNATGMFSGLTRGTTKAHLARAVLEGVGLQIADIFVAMQRDLKKQMTVVRVDGGAAANNLMMQFQADILKTPLERPKNLETTSLGALFAAGVGIGIWKNLKSIESAWQIEKRFEVKINEKIRKKFKANWELAVKRVML